MDTNAELDIAALLARSAYALDHKDLDGLEACFHEDAVFTLDIDGVEGASVFTGRDEIMGLMKGALDAQTDVRRHVISNLFFTRLDGDSAEVCTYLTLMGTQAGETRLITTGLYTDKVIKQGDAWRLINRHLKLDRPY